MRRRRLHWHWNYTAVVEYPNMMRPIDLIMTLGFGNRNMGKHLNIFKWEEKIWALPVNALTWIATMWSTLSLPWHLARACTASWHPSDMSWIFVFIIFINHFKCGLDSVPVFLCYHCLIRVSWNLPPWRTKSYFWFLNNRGLPLVQV